MTRPRRALAAALLLAVVVGASTTTGAAGSGPAAAAPGPADATAAGLVPVASVPYLNGTHLEHATIRGRDYLFAATQTSGGDPAEVRVIDVTRPARPKLLATLPCGRFQGNLQVSADRRTLVLGVDGPAADGRCLRTRGEGFLTIDVSTPSRPRPVGFASIPGGSHSTATHPRSPIVYNAPEGSPVPDRGASPVLEAWSIANPARPKLVGSVPLPGAHSPHDISFNREGTLAAVAAISAFHLVDTRDPAKPRVLYTGQCPGCQHTHEARFTPDGRTLVVNDEAMVPAYPCPGGALYFYRLDAGPHDPELVGSYAAGDVGLTPSGGAGFCTPHVFDISADGRHLAASWHEGGVRLLDISGVRGAAFGTTSSGAGAPREVASYAPPGSDWFTAKLHRGPYLYAVDMQAGLTVFRIG